MTIITLTTDFGLRDGNVGVMKGVIWGIAPAVQIADISHEISPQNVTEGAFVLGRSAPYFPAGTIHLAVVDPGVGTKRRPIAVRLDFATRFVDRGGAHTGSHYFVGPDNGLCSMLLAVADHEKSTVEIVHLDKPEFWLPEVSHVFHGRDVFAPVAARLARGIPLAILGNRINDPVRLKIPEAQTTQTGWQGQVIYIDHFGNIITNIYKEHLAGMTIKTVHLCGREIHGLVHTFGDRPTGELVALYGSTGNLIVSVVNGDAANAVGANPGDQVEAILAS
jgi:hypothetical protein